MRSVLGCRGNDGTGPTSISVLFPSFWISPEETRQMSCPLSGIISHLQ